MEQATGNQPRYKFYFRPEYGSDNMLIEFISGVENEGFGSDLFDAIKDINPKIGGRTDLWMNNEFLYSIDSDLGEFVLSKAV